MHLPLQVLTLQTWPILGEVDCISKKRGVDIPVFSSIHGVHLVFFCRWVIIYVHACMMASTVEHILPVQAKSL